MSWRSGSKLFAEMWPLIQTNIPDKEYRVEFTAFLLKKMVQDDMDPWDVEDIHPEVREALRKAGIKIREPDRYRGDRPPEPRKKSWWR